MVTERSTRPHWIAIGALSIALAVCITLLVTRNPTSDPAPAPAPAPAPSSATAPPTYTPSPYANDPIETATRERLLTISRALDLHFRKAYDFPDRLEVLIANDLLKPADLDDPWHRPVDYTRVAKARFKLCSRGPDATSYTDDDVCIGPGGREERPGR